MSERQWILYTIIAHLIGSHTAIYLSVWVSRHRIRNRLGAVGALFLCYLPYILMVGLGFMHFVHRPIFYCIFPIFVIATGGVCSALTFTILGSRQRPQLRDIFIPLVYQILTGGVLLGYIALIRAIGG